MAKNLLKPIYPYFLQDIKNILGRDLNGMHVVEIGCGPGFMLEVLSNSEALSVTGVDISEDMLKRASARSGRAALISADVTDHLPFENSTFDIVFSRGSVFFWDPLEAALKELKRITRPGAVIIIGGGYGMSTPDDIVNSIRKNHSERDKKKFIPELDPETLVSFAAGEGDEAHILSAKGRGFWVVWNRVSL